MPSSYSTRLRLELISPGEYGTSGNWGTTTNVNLGTLLEEAIAGMASVTVNGAADTTLSTANGSTDQARNILINLTGSMTQNNNIICPNVQKLYFVRNNTTGGFSTTFKTSAGTGITISNGRSRALYCDGTNVIDLFNDLASGTQIGGVEAVTVSATQTLTNKTLTSPTINTPTLSSPRVSVGIFDTNANELVGFSATASAINEITITNAAISNSPQISATGGDTNISLNLVPKGTGTVNAGGVPVVTTTGTQTLTNKTLTTPAISSISNGGTITIPSGTLTLATVTGTETLTNKTLTTPVISSISNGGTITIPSGTLTLATLTGTETLTNKTLTTPVISSISNGGTITVPSGTLTLATVTGTETITNKTISTTNSITQLDGTFTLQNTAAPTKQVRISAASVTAGQTRTVTVPDSDGTILYTNGSGASLTGVRKTGRETIWVPALAMYARVNSPAVPGNTEVGTNRIMLRSMDFADGASALYAQFAIRMPKSWNLGTLSYSVAWTANSTSTNAVVFGLQAVAISNAETIDQAFGTAVTVTDNNTATVYQAHLSPESGALTVGSSPAAQDYVVFQFYRDPTNVSDTLAATANVLGIHLYYTTNAGDDT